MRGRFGSMIKYRRHLSCICLSAAMGFVMSSCGSHDDDSGPTDGESSSDGTETEEAPAIDPGFGSEKDVDRAGTLWNELEDADYEEWPLLPDTEALQRGQSPHGYFVTRLYQGDPDELADGLILAKLNFSPEGELAALTVMEFREGYDPDNSDWFYAKFFPDGSLDATPSGVPLAGAVEPGPGQGCRGCHRNAVGGDFMFWNDGPPP